MTLTRLKDIAKDMGIPRYSKYRVDTRDELIRLIREKAMPPVYETPDEEEEPTVFEEVAEEEVVEPEEEESKAGPSDPFNENHLRSLKNLELLALMKENRISVPKKKTKNDLIEQILKTVRKPAFEEPMYTEKATEEIVEIPSMEDIGIPSVRSADEMPRKMEVEIPEIDEEEEEEVIMPRRAKSPIPPPEVSMEKVREEIMQMTEDKEDTEEHIEATHIADEHKPAPAVEEPKVRAEFTEENIAEILDLVEQIEDKEPIAGLSVARDNIMRCLGLMM